jgi:helix-hairpin-helix protein
VYKRYKASSFEEYWLASKAWERAGLSLGTARALVNAGFLTLDDLYTADDLELANVPRVGPKSLVILYALIGRTMPDAPRRRRKGQLTNRVPWKVSIASHGGN